MTVARNLFWTLILAAFGAFSAPASAQHVRPDVVLLVMLDDADYYDFGINSSDAITPNIDGIAKSGISLSQFHSASSICTPTRVSVVTGESPIHFGISRLWADDPKAAKGPFYRGKRGIPGYKETLPKFMRSLGYATFHVGKWHLGISQERFTPTGLGFDQYRMTWLNPNHGTLRVTTDQGLITTDEQSWRPAYEANEIIRFMEAQRTAGKPVFVSWWPMEVHWPLYVPPMFDNECCGFNLGTRRGQLLAMLYQWDREFGRVVDYLKQAGLYENALVIATSDNGGFHGAVSPDHRQSTGKNSLYEGGIRVPFVASWPTLIEPGSSSDQLMTSMDLFPSIVGLLGGQGPDTTGEDLSGIFTGREVKHKEPPYWQVRTVSVRKFADETRSEEFAIRDGCWKMFKTRALNDPYHLYNVCADPNETENLAFEKPDLFRRLKRELLQRRMEISSYARYERVSGPVTIPDDDRLNVHQDDITIRATIEPGYDRDREYVIYERGTGIRLALSDGELVAEVKGVEDSGDNPKIGTVTLKAPVADDGKPHEVQFMIRGYFRGDATISLFVDDEEKAKLWGEIGSNDPGPSLFAVLWEEVPAQLGDTGITLSDYRIFLSAIPPQEMF